MNTEVLSGKYSAYPEYKDSGVEWLDVIPRDWIVSKVKYLAPFQVGWTPPTKVDANFIGDNLWANISDLKGKYIKRTAKNISNEAAKEASMEISPKGSLLYSFKLSVGAVSFASQDMYTNEAIASFLEGGSLPLSYMYYALPKFLIENASTNIYGARILNQELINNAFLLAPTFEEAEKIANFLDHETAKIDTLIEKQQQLIALLKEKRQAVISHAVTKGLHPDAPMRDSGVEWLGEVPEHWGVMQLRRITHLQQGLQIPQENRFAEGGEDRAEYITIKSINAGDTAEHKEYIHSPSERVVCVEDDILLARTGATGQVVTNVSGAFHNNFFKVNYEKNKVSRDYLVYFLRVEEVKSHLLMLAGTTTIPDLNHGAFLGTLVSLPNFEEQKSICAYLDKTTERYGYIIQRAQDSVKLMQERRTALISAAVTGKIDVRNWQAPEQSKKTPEAS
tara:strand:- start:4292 stop:5641 length:1350 start_codon:yes stop_codon:yes gene_type:complete